MPDETVGAASSAAETADVFLGQNVSLDEFNQYRQSGELPARFKPAASAVAESAPDDTQEETEEAEAEEPEPEPESDPEEPQEQPLTKGAEKRIKQLLAKTKELEAQLASKQDVKQPESSPAQPLTRSKPTAEDRAADGNPKYNTYEDFVEDLADWKAEQRIETVKREQAQQEQLKALDSTMQEARKRYEDADEVIFPTAKTINEARIPQVVKEVFADSDLFIDLCYVVGSDPDELKKFTALANSNPREALRKVFEYEQGIREHQKPSGTAPEPKKSMAPKPVSPVSGASSRSFDVSDESLSPEEWMRKRNAQLDRKR